MAGVFCSQQSGRLKDVFITDYEIVDRFVGDELWGWGYNLYGVIGNDNIVNQQEPVQTISGGTNWRCIDRNYFVAGAIKNDGTLWMWGSGGLGQLGNNSRIDRSSPVQTVSGGTNWKQVSVSQDFAGAVGAIKTDGTLWMWGGGFGGKHGDNSNITKSSPVQTVSGGTNWCQVNAGLDHVAAIKTDGTLWLWGCNGFGGLGTNDTTYHSSPVQTISGGTNWKQVSVGNQNTMAIKSDGTLWGWGYNFYGMLGTGDQTTRLSPVQIGSNTNWKNVNAHNCNVRTAAIKTDGTLWTWGFNNSGALGTNDVIHRSSPVQTISGGTNWKQVSTGSNHMVAVKTDGTLWSWGCAICYSLGTADLVDRSSPVQETSGGTNWKQASAAHCGSSAVKFNSLGLP